MTSVVVSSVRNEGAFVLEWVCWYRMLGFTDIVVVTNDCTDHTPELLDCLADAGWVDHLRVDIKAGQPGITTAKLTAAHELKSVRRADHVLVCDVDEFLVVHVGAGKVADLLAAPGRPFLGMAINWRTFGSGGIVPYADTPVHQQFHVTIGTQRYLNRFVKTLHGHPRWFARLGEHGPWRLNMDKAREKTGCDWGMGELVWLNPSGRLIPAWQPDGDYLRFVALNAIDHRVAQINHYILRSAETFGLKRGTLSPVAGRDRYTTAFWAKANVDEEVDHSADRYADDFAAIHQTAMDLPGVGRMHYLCCADHVRLIAEKAGRRQQDDPRYDAFIAQAMAVKRGRA